jgi:hypothetical protein
MARDDTARERDKNELPMNRRSLLGAAGAGLASALGVSALASDRANAADYRTITVPAGETKSIRLGSGDTLENVLIDVTADGAGVSIRAHGDGWAIRNVGVKGPVNYSPKKIFSPSVPEGGSAVVENFYLGDGTTRTDGNRQGGVWVNANTPHKGELIFRNVNISNWADNGLYGSGPAYQVGSEAGSVKIENSYAENNNISNFRIGGAGSYVKNSTIVSDDRVSPVPNGRNSRGIWCKDYGHMVIEDCDIVMTGPDATHAVLANNGASATVRNSRVNGPLSGEVTAENVSNDPSKQAPDGVPMTPEEAAAGTSSASDGTTTDDTTQEEDDSQESDVQGTVLELIAGSNTSNASYEFTVEGNVQKHTSADGVSAEDNDTITENGDGTVSVTGVSGNGYGDAFLVDGPITSMNLNESDWTIRYGGEEVSVSDVAFPKKLVIDGSASPHAVSEYTFSVSGSVRKSAALGSVNDHDTVSGGDISGKVYGGVDGYRFSGDVTGFSLDGPAQVRVEDNS